MRKPTEQDNQVKDNGGELKPFIDEFTINTISLQEGYNKINISLTRLSNGKELKFVSFGNIPKSNDKEADAYKDLRRKFLEIIDGVKATVNKDDFGVPESREDIAELINLTNNLVAGKTCFFKLSVNGYINDKNEAKFGYQFGKFGFCSSNKNNLKITDFDYSKVKATERPNDSQEGEDNSDLLPF